HSFFFTSRRRHTRSKRDWSSDVCSSDLKIGAVATVAMLALGGASAANAAPTILDPDATGTLNIHKFEQPAALGDAANGLQQDTEIGRASCRESVQQSAAAVSPTEKKKEG